MANEPKNLPSAGGQELFFRHKLPRFDAPAISFDESEPKAVINVVGERLRARILKAREMRPDLFEMDERDLRKKLTDSGHQISKTDNCIRLRFWLEYERAIHGKITKFNNSNIYAGVCSRALFEDKWTNIVEKVAYMMCQPLDYESGLIEALEVANDQMRQVLDLPHIDPETGKVDHKLVAIKRQIKNDLEARLLGGVVQRSVAVIDDRRDPAVKAERAQEIAEKLSDDQIESRIHKLETKGYIIEDAEEIQHNDGIASAEGVAVARANDES